MDRYIKLNELEAYLQKTKKQVLADHRLTANTPIQNAADARDRFFALHADEASFRTLNEVLNWSRDHAITGDLVLPTAGTGNGPGLSRSTDRERKRR